MVYFLTIIRSGLFNILFIGWTALVAICFVPTLALSFERRFIGPRLWAKGSLWLLKVICGIHYRIIGAEHLPTTPFLVASKHQSAWETFFYYLTFPFPSYVLKQELLHIPIMRLYFLACRMIPIRRESEASALKVLLKSAKSRIDDHGMTVVIFPEGTRTRHGVAGHYKPGIAALYQYLKVPVVPVALNSGKYWGRQAFFKHPGTITLEFLPPIMPGLPREAFMNQLEESIETACSNLYHFQN
jgi:1-acyl-sn-glycerol-3-phosphate acyltransferase